MSGHTFVGPPAPSGGGGGGGIGGLLGSLGPLVGGLGGLFGAAEDRQTQQDVNERANFQDQTFGFGGLTGQISGSGSTAQLGGQAQGIQNLLGGGGASLFGGQGFDFGQFQQQFGPALQGVAATSGGIDPTAFGQLGNLAGAAQGLGGFAGGLFGQGPGQDFTGGRQGQAFQQGFGNLARAGNQGALRQQALGTLRQEVQGSGLLDTAINRLQNRQFAQGRLGSTGGAGETSALLNAISQQDLGLQSQAFDIAGQQGQLLQQIGQGQIGTGANLFGTSQQTFGNLGTQAQGFFGLGADIGGQQFGQNLEAAEFGRQGAQGFLDAQAGLFDIGQAGFGQNVGLGIDAFGQFLDRDRLTSETVLGLRQAEADRIQAAGASSQALLGNQGGGGGIGDLLGAAAPLLAFSDRRLKTNIKRIGSLGNIGWYKWDWTKEALEMGIDAQPTFGVMADEAAKYFPQAIGELNGYLTVDYRKLI